MRGLRTLVRPCPQATPACGSSSLGAGSCRFHLASRLRGEEPRPDAFGGALRWEAAAEIPACPRFCQMGERRRSATASFAPQGSGRSPAGNSAEATPRGARCNGVEQVRSMDTAARDKTPLLKDAAAPDSGGSRNWVDVLNSSSKWVAVAGCAASLVVLRNRESVWFLVGMLGNSFLSKLLKRLFRHQRPDAAKEKDKGDYGMPSSHAQSLSFLCTYAALACIAVYGRKLLSIATVSVITSSCIFFIWLRVHGGLHTTAQVVVGGVIGVLDAFVWNILFHTLSRAIATKSISSSTFDSGLFGLFAAFTIFAIHKEIKSRKDGPSSTK